jgi:hypothetical protein
LSTLGCYYFYTRCESTPEVDVRFAVEMDDALKGNTGDTESLKRPEVKCNEKKKAFAAVVEISNTAKSIASAMEKTNRLAEQAQLISVAQALGKHDILENILKTMSHNY